MRPHLVRGRISLHPWGRRPGSRRSGSWCSSSPLQPQLIRPASCGRRGGRGVMGQDQGEASGPLGLWLRFLPGPSLATVGKRLGALALLGPSPATVGKRLGALALPGPSPATMWRHLRVLVLPEPLPTVLFGALALPGPSPATMEKRLGVLALPEPSLAAGEKSLGVLALLEPSLAAGEKSLGVAAPPEPPLAACPSPVLGCPVLILPVSRSTVSMAVCSPASTPWPSQCWSRRRLKACCSSLEEASE